VRIVTRDIEVFGNKVIKVSNAIDRIIHNLTAADVQGVSALERARRAQVFRPESAASIVQSVINKTVRDLPAFRPGRVMEPLEKAGEARLKFKPSEEQFKVLKALGDERLQILQINKWLGEINKELQKFGIAVASSVGLAEGAIGKRAIPPLGPKSKLTPEEYEAELPVQTLPLARFGFLGAGAVNPARMFQPTQTREMVGGTPPRVMGAEQRSMLEAGMISPKTGKELRTAFVNMAETTEDMVLITEKAAKEMGIVKEQTVILKEAAAGLTEGMQLVNKTLLGTGFKGETVEFALKGTQAKITKMFKGIDRGVEFMGLQIQQQMPFVTGSKVTTAGGFKGLARVVPSLGKDVAGKEIEAAISQRGAMKRLDIRDIAEALTNELADAAKVSSRDVATMIEKAVKDLGMSVSEAVEHTATQLGLKGFTGMTTVMGGLLGRGAAAGRPMMVGGVHFGALGEGREKGMEMQKQRFVSKFDIDALMSSFGKGSHIVQQFAHSNEILMEDYKDLIQELRTLGGEVDVAKESLKEFMPTQLTALPHGEVPREELKGTILDEEKFKQPFVMLMRNMQGELTKFRVPGLGVPGGRGLYETATGTVGATPVTRQLEQLRQAAVDLELAFKGLDKNSAESMDEASHVVTQTLNKRIQDLFAARKVDPKAAEAEAKAFFDKLSKIADKEMSASFIKTRNVETGKISGKGGTVGQYLAAGKDPFQQLLSLRDVLTKRAEGAPGGKFQAVAGTGQLFDPKLPDRAKKLQEAMDAMGVSLEGDAERIAAAYKRQEVAQEKFIQSLLGKHVMGSVKGKGTKTLMQALEGGTSISPYALVTSMPAARTGLTKAEAELHKLAAAGHDVTEALKLIEQAQAMQAPGAIKPGTIMIHKDDLRVWAEEIAKRTGMSVNDAIKHLLTQQILTHRFPTTGGASFVPARITPTGEEQFRGKFGLPSVPTMLPKAQEAAMRAPLEAEKARLMALVTKAGGQASEELRSQVKEVNAALEGLTSEFHHASQNLDFDGDAIVLHAGLSKEAAQEISGFGKRVREDSHSIGNILGKFRDNMEETISSLNPKEIDEAMKVIAKGRVFAPGEKGTSLRPTSPAELEAVQKLISPKLATGLATDAYNQLQTITGEALQGSEETAEGLKHIMLNINQALAQKHIAGGAIKFQDMPAFKFIGELSKAGGVETIIKQMGKGGEYEKLGQANEVLMKKRREFFQLMSPAELSKKVGKEITTGPQGNWEQEIEKLVKAESLTGFLYKIQQTLVKEAIRAMIATGMSASEAQAETAKQFHGKQGLDLSAIESALHPATFATRQRGITGRLGVGGLDINSLLENMLSRVDTARFSENAPSGKDIVASLRKGLIKFLGSTRNQFKPFTEAEFTKMEPRAAAAGVKPGGMFRGGQVFLSAERTITPVVHAIEDLGKIQTGQLKATPLLIKAISESISDFAGRLAHENIHKLLSNFQEPVEEFTRAMKDSAGPFAGYGKEIEQALLRLASVRSIKATKPLGTYQRVLAEETLTRVVQPEAFQELFGHLPKSVQAAIKAMGAKVIALLPDVEREALEAGTRLSSAVMEGLTQSLGMDISKIRENVHKTIKERMVQPIPAQFPQKERLEMLQERKGQFEQLLSLSRSVHGLTPGAMTPGGGLGNVPVGHIIGDPKGKMKALVEEMQQGLPFADPESYANFRKRWNEQIDEWKEGLKAMEASTPGLSAFRETQKMIKEYQAARLQYLLNEARKFNDMAEELKRTGGTGTNEFTDAVNQFGQHMEEAMNFLSSTLTRGGRGIGRVTSIAATAKGELLEPAIAAGVKPTPQMFEGAIREAAGRGPGEAQKFEPVAKVLREIIQLIAKGESETKLWADLLELLKQSPADFKVNLNKVIEVLGKAAGYFQTIDGRVSATSQAFANMAKMGKTLRDQLVKREVTNQPTLLSALSATKGTRQVSAMGAPTFAGSIKEQIAAAEAQVADMEKKLTQVFRATGKKMFESMHFQIIDPATGQVVQKLTADFKRAGTEIKGSLEQSGIALQTFGKHLQNAMRRVVQWGAATGIIYGTIRAFYVLNQTIVSTQTAMANLGKLVDTSVINLKELQDGAVSLAKEFGTPIEEVIKGMEVFAQQGMSVNDIMKNTKATMLAVNVTTLTAEQATEALTAASKMFGDEISDNTQFVDAWGSIASKHAITAKDLAESVQRSGAAAEEAGLNFNDFMGIVTAIGTVTRKTGSEIGTATRFMFKQLAQPKAIRALGDIGIKTIGDTGDIRPMMDVLGELAGKWDTLTRSQQLSIAMAVGGARHFNDIVVLMKNYGEALTASADAQNSQGFAAQKSAQFMQTYAKQLEVLKQSVTGLALALGKAILPAMTGATKAISGLVDIISKLPDPLLQASVLGVGGMVALDKSANFLLSTFIDLIGTSNQLGSTMQKNLKHKGVLGTITGAPKNIGKALFGGVSAVGQAGADVAGMGIIAKGLDSALRKFKEWKVGTQAAAEGAEKFAHSVEMGTIALDAMTVASEGQHLLLNPYILAILGVAAAVGAASAAYHHFHQTGKEVEEALADQIGKSEEATKQFQSQATAATGLSVTLNKYKNAVKNLDTGDIAEQIGMGTFEGPAKAAKDYADQRQKIATSIAKVSPNMVEGISESGDILMNIDDGFKNIAISAADAQKMVTSALKVDIIKHYADELTKSANLWEKFVNVVSGGKKGTLSADLKEARDQVNKITDQRKKLASEGYASLGLQSAQNEAMAKYLELNEKALGVASEMKRVLESMPTMADTGLAAQMLSGPDLVESLRTAAPTGAFGRGATLGSIEFKQMAKNFGLGGAFDFTTGTSPALVQQAMQSRGILPQVGGAKAAKGDIAIISAEAAAGLLKISEGMKGLDKASDDTAKAIEEARSGFIDMDQTTGELVFRFFDSLKGQWNQASLASSEEMKSGIQEVFSRDKIKEESEKAKKLLTIQFTGALAGIRIPQGAIQAGPARFRELTAEQRTLGTLPDEMERLSRIEAELSDKAKKFNEDLEGDVGEALEGTGKGAERLAMLLDTDRDQIIKLMQEGFDLTVLNHVVNAMHELNITMEKTKQAIRDAVMEEENRFETLKHVSGALKGLGEMPSISLGKRREELSPMERLQVATPAFGKAMSGLAGLDKTREIQSKGLLELKQQRQSIDEMVRDLGTSRERLTKETIGEKLTMAKKVTPEMQEVIKAIEKSAKAPLDVSQKQLTTQQQMAGYLALLVKADAIDDPKKRAMYIKKELGAQSTTETLKAMGTDLGSPKFNEMFKSALGITERKTDTGRSQFSVQSPKLASEDQQTEMNELLNKYIGTLNKMQAPGREGMQKVWGKQLKEAQDQLLSVPEVQERLKAKATETLTAKTGGGGAAGGAETKALEDQKIAAENRAKIAQASAQLYKELADKEAELYAALEGSTKALSAKDPALIAEQSMKFQISIEEVMLGFKKAEDLYFTKIASDLEGPFARVGQPGFKTQFEQRREAAEQASSRPVKYDQLRAREAERQKIDFDEQEAKIKQQQEIETDKLKKQQGQAETARSAIEDALTSGELRNTGLEGMASSFRDTLTEQLSTSEQAEMGPEGVAQFKGIPALDDMKRFLQQIKEQTQKNAQAAAAAAQKDINRVSITEPIQTTMNENAMRASETSHLQLHFLETIATNTAGMVKSAADATKMAPEKAEMPTTPAEMRAGIGGPLPAGQTLRAFAPTGMFKGTGTGTLDLRNQVGLSNMNRIKELNATYSTGNDKAIPGSLVSTASTNNQNVNTAGSRNIQNLTQAAPTNAAAAAPTAAQQTEAFTTALNKISDLLQTLTSQGFKIPDSLTQSITTVGTVVTDALGKGIKVEVTNPAVIVHVDNFSDIEKSLAGISGVGAQVTDIKLRLGQVEGDLARGGTVDAKIDAAVKQVEGEIATEQQSIDSLKTQVYDLSKTIPDPKEVTDLVTSVAVLQDSSAGIQKQLDDNARTITALDAGLLDVKVKVDIFDEFDKEVEKELNDLEVRANNVDKAVTDFDGRITTTEDDFKSLADSVDLLIGQVDDNKTGLSQLGLDFAASVQSINGDIRLVNTRVDNLETAENTLATQVQALTSQVKTTVNVANQALSNSMGKQSR